MHASRKQGKHKTKTNTMKQYSASSESQLLRCLPLPLLIYPTFAVSVVLRIAVTLNWPRLVQVDFAFWSAVPTSAGYLSNLELGEIINKTTLEEIYNT